MNVKVSVRVRPALSREVADGVFHSSVATSGNDVYITTKDNPVLVKDGKADTPDGVSKFSFDYVADQGTSTEQMYSSCCKQSIEDVLHGVNATILAYGQTGSGKTHTMLGDASNKGVALLAADQLLDPIVQSSVQVVVEMSYLQIYGKHVTDLLTSDADLKNLPIRQNNGEVVVEGLSRHPVLKAEDVAVLIERGASRRAKANTELNSTSSRSHAVLTYWVTTRYWNKPSDGAYVAKCNIVDLAGSERVKDSGVKGQSLQEAKQINLSLFHLVRVVQALVDKKPFVPYSDDRLCFMLQDALGGNCLTTVIATISPAQKHAFESRSTLFFALACSHVENRAQVNKRLENLQQHRPWNEKRQPKAKPKPQPLPWQQIVLGSESAPGGRITFETKQHQVVSALAFGNSTNPLVLCLHGHPSSAQDCYEFWLLSALVYSGFYAVALDMPGRGHSKGTPFKTRSEFNLVKGGAADFVAAVIAALGYRTAVLVGYDWGAGIALSMAHSNRTKKLASKIVVFHPAYNEQNKGDLEQIACPTLLLWCKQDQFHSYSKWKPNSKRMAAALGQSYQEYVVSEKDWANWGWRRHTAQLERTVITFLTGVDPVPKIKGVFARPEHTEQSTEGKKVTRCDNIVLKSQAADLDQSIFEAKDEQKDAVAEFCALYHSGKLFEMFQQTKTGSTAHKLFSRLPCVSPATLSNPEQLITLGLWQSSPKASHYLQSACRYGVGRQVLVRLKGVNPCPANPDYMAAVWMEGRQFTTHRATIAGFDGPSVVVDVETNRGDPRRIRVSREHILQLNHGHQLPVATGSEECLVLEDGIRCDYSKHLTRAKMCQIACALAPLVQQLDFSGDLQTVEHIQKQCVLAVRGCLDLITFQRDAQGNLNGPGSRTRDSSRYCKDDAARFAVHGQGHCHTVSSVMAAFLSPWCKLLGIDLKYRGGYTFNPNNSEEEIADSPELHQWLEFTTRPSNRSFVCDLYRSDGSGDVREQQQFLALPVEFAYQRIMYPNGKLLTLSGYPVTLAPVCATDFFPETDQN